MVLEHELIAREGPQDRLLLLIHGYGESTAPMTDRLDLIDPEGRFVALVPRAPFTHKGADIWHRALFGNADDAVEQYHSSLARLGGLVDEVCARDGFDPAEAVFAGFSQGGGLAIGLGLATAERPRPAGCIGWCAFAPPIEGLAIRRGRVAGLPVLLTSSHDDVFIGIDSSRQSAAVLRDLGVDLSFIEVHTGHRLTDELAKAAGAWLGGEAVGRSTDGIDAGDFAAWIHDLWDLTE
ncbi:MAG: hypothetical protein R2699_04225 [Acidimicrobiales bacterium]|nr:hypothetical protein [Acidimicrobiales bacterium]MCB1260268.1 hypothetical protein [Acidimicrobiales bacterium]